MTGYYGFRLVIHQSVIRYPAWTKIIWIDTDILRNGIRLVRLKSAEVLLYIV